MGGSVVPSRRGRHRAQASSRSARQPGPPSPISKNGHSTGATRRARRCLREPAMTGASYAWNTPACYGPPAAPLGAPRRATAEASVRRLLAHAGDPNLRDTRQHCTPLEEAQMGDSPGAARSKLSSGPSPRICHIPPAPEPKHPGFAYKNPSEIAKRECRRADHPLYACLSWSAATLRSSAISAVRARHAGRGR
jgi:hypothetical protein